MTETFDVFLSHNSKDKPVVRQIAARLRDEYDLSAWLDEKDLQPGRPWQDGLEQAMQATRAAAVLLGGHGLGSWQRPEIRVCLSQMIERDQPVIPVLLPGAPEHPEIPLFLRENTWVDLRDGITEAGLDRLVWGITGKKPGPSGGPEPEVSLEEAPELTRHFRGRETEVASCLAALRSSRLVTITGLAGAGKTELSLAAAREALTDPALRPQRALWLLLAGMRSVEEIAGRLALAFGISHVERIEPLARAIGPQRVLLLLDNAEDLIGIARLPFQQFCGDLLRLCPGLRLLLTSRRLLGDVPGCEETELQVGRLRPEVALAVFRSAATRLSPQELASPDLEALVRALDGHPRSLILMAGQAGRGLSLAELRSRLDRDGDAAVMARELLAETQPGTDPELRTKRLISSLNLSYEPLAADHPAAAELFLWLGLFPAGLLLEAIPGIFGEAATTHQVLLLDFNLAEIDEGDAPRLFLPAPVRWYAKRRLSEIPADRQSALLMLTLWSLGKHLGAAMKQSWSSNAPQSLGLALREEPNLASLLPQACNDITGEPARADALADALTPWMYLMSRIDRPTTALLQGEQAAAAISQASPGTSAEARLLKYLGDLYVRTDRLREAEDAYQSALPIYQQIEDRLGEANTRIALGDLYVRTARLREAEDAYQSALPIYQQIEARLGEANTRIALGDLYRRTDRLREAEDAYQSALPIYQQIEDRLGEANTLRALGNLYVRTDRLREAEDAYQSALPIYQQIEDRLGEANTLRTLGDLYRRTDRLREAEDAYQSALPIYQQIEDRLGEANTRIALGDLYRRTDRLREAEDAYQSALPIYQQIEDRLGEANTLQGLGNLALAHDAFSNAFDLFLQTLHIQRLISDLLGEGGSFGYLARTARAASHLERAVALGGQAWRINRRIESLFNQRLVLDDLADCFDFLKELEAHRAAVILAWHLARTMEEPSAEQRHSLLRQRYPDFHPEAEPADIWLTTAEETLIAALERYEKILANRGEDPLAPL